MLGYGHDESAPTPGGMFRNPFRGCTWVYCGMFCGVSWVGVTLLVNRSQHYRNPLAAVGADLSCPHIRKHTRNGEGKCVCGDVNVCVW